MQGYWTSFIRSGDPNTYKLATAPRWETFSAGNMTRIRIGNDLAVGMESVDAGQAERCRFLSGIGAGLKQ